MQTDRRAPLGAFHLSHFLEGTGLPVSWGENAFPGVPGTVADGARADPNFQAMRDQLRASLRGEVDRLQAAGASVTRSALYDFLRSRDPNPVNSQTGLPLFRGFLLENAPDPNLFWAFHGIERVRIRVSAADIEIGADRISVPVVFELEDTYTWNEEHLQQRFLPAAVVAAEMLWLQGNCPSVATYRQFLEVSSTLDLSPPLTGRWQGTYSWDCGSYATTRLAGSSPIVLELQELPQGALEGRVSYLGGTARIVGARYNAATWGPWGIESTDRRSPDGTEILLIHEGSTSFVRNDFSARVRGGVLTGITSNGDSPATLDPADPGCSAPFTHSGEFTVRRSN